MKRQIGYILMFILMVLVGCDRKEDVATDSDFEIMKKPEQTYLTENQIQDHVDKEINLAIDLGNENVIQEAADVITLTRSAITSILEEDYADAIELINRAIAKAELITRSDHPTKIVSEVDIEVLERVKNAETAMNLIHNIDSLMDLGELQEAKHLMNRLTNELRITRESISLSSYLQTLKNADQLLKNKQREQALLELNSILGNIKVERSITPLPLIIAQKMINEADNLISEEHADKESVLTLLKNAEYHVRFSELLGYGKTQNEYNNIFGKIEKIRSNLDEDNFGRAKELAGKVIKDLDQLQKDISVYKHVEEKTV